MPSDQIGHLAFVNRLPTQVILVDFGQRIVQRFPIPHGQCQRAVEAVQNPELELVLTLE